MRILLEKVLEYLEIAQKAESERDYKRAKINYLKASECLLKVAKETKGEMKQIRYDIASRLLEKANSITVKPERTMDDRIKDIEGKIDEVADFYIREKPNVKFEDVAGLDDVKAEIQNKLIYPFKYPEKARKFGIKSGGGILLYGPPGTGKTYIAKAIANEVDADFFTVKPSEIMSKWVGETEQKVDRLFQAARSCEKAIIFIDEVEALIPKRRDSSSTVMQRVVPQFLAEMNGLESKNENILFIGATNEPWSLDPAVLRPGRFDERIYIPPPDLEARKKLFELNLKDKPLEENVDFGKLAELTAGYSGADIRGICLKASVIPFREWVEQGIERKIEMRDILEVLSKVKPSIDEKMVKRFEEFAARR
jgi:transitional endoplasmic reticulum ATPase